ncbi:MAG: ADP-ribosylglycohydrolase family protein [Chloroflexi bacterium]|nr:ADP-ribosylglycohydrolase family protein [Chloroflexota bacterium]MBP7044579.1 ADP-ribosylglycohydrolase family protein [Chloroflexota bacterium]
MTTPKERFMGCLLGLACGDAVGTTVEFKPRGSFAPMTDMVGGGPFHLQAGQWTDDTSMALCLGYSLVETGGFDAADQMNRYCRWYDDGYLSSTGRCFDIGNATSAALHRYKQSGDPFSGSTDPYSAGNGSIMRLAPVVMAFTPDEAQALHYAGESSKTTHAAPECVDACRLYGGMLHVALQGGSKNDILGYRGCTPITPKIKAIADGGYRQKSLAQIKGSGYVVDSLEAALWCFYTSDSYETAVLQAVNLGDDADTTAAVCGQIAGAFYGRAAIPASWREKVTMGAEIEKLALDLMGMGRG